MKIEYFAKAFKVLQPVTLIATYITGSYEFGVGFTLFCWIGEQSIQWYNKQNA